ncbi:TadE/TadG family type IV pilus assembly protein [Streptomyces harbinensis]|uniref:TadE/TadG family type IV pilus assembly protein n=1 Tax=Streptomyces harbinensis TaxID=1176198 RepID=UPI00371C01E2
MSPALPAAPHRDGAGPAPSGHRARRPHRARPVRAARPAHAARPVRAARSDRGAVLVEFTGMFPLILLMLAVALQCAVIGYGFHLAGNAADEAARAGAAAGGGEGACGEAARAHIPDSWSMSVSCPLQGEVRQARVELRVPVLFPGAFNLPITISGTAGAVQEGP